MQDVQELLGQTEQESGKKHGLNVRDKFRLPHQSVQPSTFLQTLMEMEKNVFLTRGIGTTH